MTEPTPDSHARRAEVLARLRRGGWVNGTELATEECGGSEGLRRLRELRKGGHVIVKRKVPGSNTWEYRLVEHLPGCLLDHPTDTDCDWRLVL